MFQSTSFQKFGVRIVYTLSAAFILTLSSQAIANRPTIKQMEYAVYDQFQRWTTIDKYINTRGDIYSNQSVLEELLFINIDTTFLDLERDRIKRDKLAQLLSRVDEELAPKAVMLDYEFSKPSFNSSTDSLLISRIINMEDYLVLPYTLFEADFNLDEVDTNLTKPEMLYIPSHHGYLDYRSPKETKDMVQRFVQVGKESDPTSSLAYALIKVIRNKKELPSTKSIPKIFEINYILRNQILPGNREAVRFYDANNIINEKIASPSKGKIIFIGLFEDYRNKYKYPIDQAQTPVQSNMNGIYLIVNTYLNIVLDSYLKRPAPSFVFIIFMILIFIGVLCEKYTRFDSSIGVLIWVLSIIGFSFMLFILYYYYHYKFPFVLITSFLILNKPLYRKVKSYFKIAPNYLSKTNTEEL